MYVTYVEKEKRQIFINMDTMEYFKILEKKLGYFIRT